MIFLFKNEDELKEHIKNSYEDLKKDIDKVKEAKRDWVFDIPFPDYAIKNFEEIEKNYENLDSLSKTQLRNLFRDIEYTSKLDSAHEEKIIDVANKLAFKLDLEYLSDKSKEKFWSLYNKLVTKGKLMEGFKYESLEEIKDLMFQGVDIEDIFASFAVTHDEAYELEQILKTSPEDRTEQEQRRLEKAGELNVSTDKRIYIQTIEDLLR